VSLQPPREIKPSFSIALLSTTRRRIPASARTQQGSEQGDLVAMLKEKSFSSKLSGNEIYCTKTLLIPIKIMLCSKLYHQKVSN
jgi:hypothetical protein